jgi:acyl dehydratase
MRVEVGLENEPYTPRPLRPTDFVRYQGASGDMNPIHHDPAVAERAGMASVLAVGMLAAGILGCYAADWLGAENVRRYAVRFKSPAWPGDEITYTGKVIAIREQDGETVADVELKATRQTGDAHLTAEATFVVRDS